MKLISLLLKGQTVKKKVMTLYSLQQDLFNVHTFYNFSFFVKHMIQEISKDFVFGSFDKSGYLAE